MIHERAYQHHFFCQTYGHHWQATSKSGTYRCSNCRAMGYCPGCLLLVPTGALTMRCQQHEEKREEAR